MGVLIRQKAFETNSSSSHSISVVDRPFALDMPSLKEGEEITSTEDFGWGIEKHNDFYTKLQYCIADNVNTELLKMVIEDETGVIVDLQKGEGYIDHQSTGTASRELDSKEKIRNFLFNKNSWLFISNDNGGPDHDDMEADTEEYGEDGSIHPFRFHYELIIDGIGSHKTKNKPTKSTLNEAINKMTDYSGYLLLPEGVTFDTPGRIETDFIWVDEDNYDKYKELPNNRKGYLAWGNWTDDNLQLIRFVAADARRWEIQDKFEELKNQMGYVEVGYEIKSLD